MSFDTVYTFFQFLNSFRQIERIIYVDENKRKENDAEHSYQLAMLGWYIAQTGGLEVEIDKIIRYALVHDLVEVYAGDTLPFTRGEKGEIDKDEKEKLALQAIRENFSEFPQLADWIETYEKKEDPESRFVYALDKMIATMNNYHLDGGLWKDYDIGLDQVVGYSLEKAKSDPTIHALYVELIEILTKREDVLFSSYGPSQD